MRESMAAMGPHHNKVDSVRGNPCWDGFRHWSTRKERRAVEILVLGQRFQAATAVFFHFVQNIWRCGFREDDGIAGVSRINLRAKMAGKSQRISHGSL